MKRPGRRLGSNGLYARAFGLSFAQIRRLGGADRVAQMGEEARLYLIKEAKREGALRTYTDKSRGSTGRFVKASAPLAGEKRSASGRLESPEQR